MTSEPGRYPPNAEAEHRLLTMLTVATLHVSLLRRQLDRQQACSSVEMRETVERLAQTHRAMIDELRPPRRDV